MSTRRALLIWSLFPSAALAQTQRKQSVPIYRCGPDGRQLSDKPCAGAAPASAVRFDEPSAADRDAAQRRSRDEARQADQLQAQRERLERQPAPPPQGLSSPPAPADPPAKKAQAGKTPQPSKAAKPSKAKKKSGDKAGRKT